jgi:quinol monooxygenase YgiN
MSAREILFFGATLLASSLAGPAIAAETERHYVRLAEMEVDPAHLAEYQAAAKEEIEASVRLEPGVIALYAVSLQDHPSHIRVFEIYASEAAYKAHLETPHFRKYKAATQDMVRSLRLFDTIPITLGAKAK